jgi:hypothetical protein
MVGRTAGRTAGRAAPTGQTQMAQMRRREERMAPPRLHRCVSGATSGCVLPGRRCKRWPHELACPLHDLYPDNVRILSIVRILSGYYPDTHVLCFMLCYVISGVLDFIIFHNTPFWEDECIRILPCGTLAASAAARKVSGYSDGLTLCMPSVRAGCAAKRAPVASVGWLVTAGPRSEPRCMALLTLSCVPASAVWTV